MAFASSTWTERPASETLSDTARCLYETGRSNDARPQVSPLVERCKVASLSNPSGGLVSRITLSPAEQRLRGGLPSSARHQVSLSSPESTESSECDAFHGAPNRCKRLSVPPLLPSPLGPGPGLGPAWMDPGPRPGPSSEQDHGAGSSQSTAAATSTSKGRGREKGRSRAVRRLRGTASSALDAVG